jgi:SPP1 family predicted phage head-tail adaptor
MRAGDMRHRIQLQTRSVGQDALGGQSPTWTTTATVWAEILPLTGRERMLAGANQSEVSSMVTIRYQAQFSDPKAMAAMRILYGSRILNIESSNDVEERHKIIELSCSEGLNNG